jgi:hypothetical protein
VALTTTDLLEAIRRRATMPTSEQTYQDAGLLNYATEEMRSYVAPAFVKQREDYFVTSVDVAITATAFQSIRLPSRAIGNALRGVFVVDAAGEEFPLSRLRQETGQYKLGFELMGNTLKLSNAQSCGYSTLRLYYALRAPVLVLPAANTVAVVASVGSSNMSVVSPPAGIPNGARVDIIKASSPYEAVYTDLTVTVAGSNYSFSGVDFVAAGVQVGDYVVIADQSPVVTGLPDDFWPFLAQRVAFKILSDLGDEEGAAAALDRAKDLEGMLSAMTAQRVESAPTVLVNNTLLGGV